MKKLMVGNWKMNQTSAECRSFFSEFNEKFSGKTDAWIAPQALYLSSALAMTKIRIGAQNCSEALQGAFTGELSPKSIKDVGGSFVILGHSERRQIFHEQSRYIGKKIKNAHSVGLDVIYCVGETLEQRETKETFSILADQLDQALGDQSLSNAQNLIIAYEPVWAIGTGKTATPAMAQEAHAFIRAVLTKKFPDFGNQVKILYGGSVKPDNVQELMGQVDIDGALVGGASLKARDFLALCGDK
jgi:triosephosphate isomerase (TIM)